MAPSRAVGGMLDLINMRYSAYVRLQTLKDLMVKQVELISEPKAVPAVEDVPELPAAAPIATTASPSAPKGAPKKRREREEDPVTKMKNYLLKMEKEMLLPESFKHIEGANFSFVGKKVVMSWSGERLGVRLGGGFQQVDYWTKQFLAHRQIKLSASNPNLSIASSPSMSMSASMSHSASMVNSPGMQTSSSMMDPSTMIPSTSSANLNPNNYNNNNIPIAADSNNSLTSENGVTTIIPNGTFNGQLQPNGPTTNKKPPGGPSSKNPSVPASPHLPPLNVKNRSAVTS